MKVLLKLLPYLRPYKKTFALIIFLGVLMGAVTTSILPLIKQLFDDVLTKKEATLVWTVPLGIVLRFAINGVARFFHLYLLKTTGEKIAAQIRQDLQDKFMSLNLNFHNSYNAGSGGLLSRTLNDVVIVQWGIQIGSDLIKEPLTALFLIGALFTIDWKLALFSFTAAPFAIVVLKQLGRSIRKYANDQQDTLEDLTSTLKETLDGVRVIQSFNLEGELRRRLKSVVDRYLFNRKKILAREEAAGPITEFLASVILALIIGYMADQIYGGHATQGTFMAFLTALLLFQQPIKKIQDASIRIQQTITAVARIFEILESPDIVPQEKDHKAFPANWDRIEFKNVTFSYEKADVLKNINLTVRRGETVALVGESGSGKSTLVNLLERFFDPTQGEIRIGGIPIEEMSLKELRKNIALVTQDVFLFNDTIERNIQAGDFDKTSQVLDAARAANADAFILTSAEGYQTRVGDRGAKLSGGERQRVSIARAIYKDAPILILDEATSALDSASEVEVQKGLDKLVEGRTTFVIAHRLATVVKADRIIVMKKGEIVETGTHDELLKNDGSYSHFFSLQSLR